ncbi:MAG: hypothetical protein A2W61_08470 [Deltaproteobacteria bacterium RIFCSPLOWO2_01_44_7]|nr:MAG: hypothetical protein A2712_10965 [Deltaproteobacteria bacterium RIFCSPHIGHO2_01_FULL_43_49]OGQ16574.1 MAG: hypothetical protein A3D22_06665 [Deltaproteobacteria bacterium RIFCSPHIGHO2_02_FULL_44_53]OGQ28390.1 MAG: hypothetical protein A3D98_06370 [Deltaproteobacteria bacterium RIFCSPHIGHO2_12_FULL_44_21]OGQ32461.1 MAG: hypothetical protein A2979_10930 [Deltaproteobacteria bacterium RIFCSPLOWO2_01_FULL_45_74]OGQ39115.1 MAG: hypothetical protein A2W61_08470 [Deltaproteobacteria bacterium 
MFYTHRLAEKRLEETLNNKDRNRDTILVEGARQVGKTSLVKHLCSSRPHLWLDLEKEKVFLRKIDATNAFEEFSDLLAAEKNFVPGQGRILVIDEAQESRLLGGYVRYFKETWENQTVVLLGSLMARLFRKDVRYPVGRTHSIKIYPFTFEEFLLAFNEELLLQKIKAWEPEKPLSPPFHQKALQSFQVYLTIGGLPEVLQWHVHKKNWEEKLKDLAYGYTEDFKRVEGEEKSALFELTFKRIAQTLGSPSKLSTIIEANQPGYRLLPDMINLLENWMLVFKIEIETPTAPGVSRIPPKRYLFDHGIRHVFSPVSLRISEVVGEETRLGSTYLGGIFENAVLNEIKPWETQKTVVWRKAVNSSEIDFLFTKNKMVIPIEVKATGKMNRRHFSSLLEYLNFSGGKFGLLVSAGGGAVYSEKGKSIYQTPFYAIRQSLDLLR